MRMKYLAHFVSEDGRCRTYPIAKPEVETHEFVDGGTLFTLRNIHHIPELSAAEMIDAGRVRAWH
jgi:hypothetical protein